MDEKRYLISDAAHEIKVEAHVLRYWEEELELEIHRNDMGHRYYSEVDIEQLRSIRELKNKGFQLKAIKLLLPRMGKVEMLDEDKLMELKNKLDEALGIDDEAGLPATMDESKSNDKEIAENSKMNRFRDIMGSIMQDALLDNNERLTDDLTRAVKYSVIKEIDYLFRTKEEQEEERFRKLDRLIRDMQQARQQTAASGEGYIRKKQREKRKYY